MSLTRRLFLNRASSIGVAASLPVAATVAVAAAPVAPLAALMAAARKDENPEIVAIAAELTVLERRYAEALREFARTRAIAEATFPSVPPELRLHFNHPLFGGSTSFGGWADRDVLGQPLMATHVDGKILPPPKVISTDFLTNFLECALCEDKRTRAARALMPRAAAFQQEREDALAACGFTAAREEKQAAGFDLTQLVHRIRDIEARTVVGLLVKAKAMAAAAGIENDLNPGWGRMAAFHNSDDLAQSVARVLDAA